jgi:gas vesicle protein
MFFLSDITNAWQLSEFLSMVAMLGATAAFFYIEIKSMRQELKSEFNDIRNIRKVDIEQAVNVLRSEINDLKQTQKNDLFGHRKDLKEDIMSWKNENQNENIELRHEIISLTQKISRLEGAISTIKKPFKIIED